MGNEHIRRWSRHFKKDDEKNNKNQNKNNPNEPGEDFYLEDWTICKDKDNIIDTNTVKFDNDLLISEVKKNPFDDYEISKTLGDGAYGQVFLVKHRITGSIRAMKVIKKGAEIFDGSNDEEVLNEINILKKMDHPNIIKIFEFYIDIDNYYLITEYCGGGDLFDTAKATKLNEYQVAYIMFQLFSALNYCHKRKIIHRDLKPENILISKNENNFIRIKICDFGTSQIFKKGEMQKEFVGSVYYIAPEVIKEKYNFKCDLWSCGIIMFILLTQKIPFCGEEDDEILRNILTQKYDTKRLEKFSDNTKDLVSKLLEKDINKRINAEQALEHKYFEEFKVKDLLNEIKDKKKVEKFIENLKNYKRKSILQETILAYLIHNFPQLEEISDACKLFDKIDYKGNGQINYEDLYIGLSVILENDKLRNDIEAIFANLDTDKNNYIGYEEFVRGAIDKNCFLDEKILQFAFNFFDKNKKGVITINELSCIFKNHILTKDITEGLQKIISEVDEDGNGQITYDKFCKLMKNLIT